MSIDMSRETHLGKSIDICQYIDMRQVCCVQPADARLSVDEASDIARALKALADPTRLRIVSMISSDEEICQCDLEVPLGLSQPTVSHHLKVLTDAGILDREKRGKWAFYRVASATMADIAATLAPAQASSTNSSMVSSK